MGICCMTAAILLTVKGRYDGSMVVATNGLICFGVYAILEKLDDK